MNVSLSKKLMENFSHECEFFSLFILKLCEIYVKLPAQKFRYLTNLVTPDSKVQSYSQRNTHNETNNLQSKHGCKTKP